MKFNSILNILHLIYNIGCNTDNEENNLLNNYTIGLQFMFVSTIII